MKNKTVLITGGSEGLGFAIAKKCAQLGAKVILLARDEQKLAHAAAVIECDYIVCDLRNLPDCENAYEKVIKQHGEIDILVNNAGIWSDDKSESKDIEIIRHTIATNLTGAIYLTELFLPKFKERGTGTIFFTNSSAGWKFGNDPVARSYSASKWGLRGYAEALETHLKPTKIKVISLYPGGMNTDMFEKSGWEKSTAHDQPWQADVDKVADAAVFALNAPDDINIGTVRVRGN